MPGWLAIAVAVATGLPQQDVRVSASLSNPSVLTGETVVLEVRVETQGVRAVRVNVPPLPASISVVGTQDFTHDQLRVPGGRTRIVQRNMILMPGRSGKFLIPSIPIDVEGTTYRTDPLELDVVPGGALPEPPPSDADSDIRLIASLDRDTVYVGEQVILAVEALFPRDLRQRQTRPATFETPNPAGFWIMEMPGGLTGGVRMFRGDLFETQRYRRVYVPLEPGAFAMEPVRLRYELRRGYLYAPENRELVSDSMRITVLPLPEDGRPRTFTGAVGKYRATAWLQPSAVAAGDAATLNIELEGTGNVKTLPPPRLPSLDGVEIFPPSEAAEVTVRGDRLGGSKRFTWVLVPEAAGEIDLGAIEYAFFDPETGAYGISRMGPLTLTVDAAGSDGTAASADTALSPIRPSSRGGRWGFVQSPAYLAVQLIPLFAVIAAFAVRRRRNTPAVARRDIRERWETALTRIRSTTLDQRVFLDRLATAIRSAFAELTGESSLRAAPTDAIGKRLEAHGASSYTATAATALLRRIDHARFGGGSMDALDRERILAETRSVLDRLDADTAAKERSLPSGWTSAGLVLLMVLPGAGHAQEDSFRSGVEAYLRADYGTAAAEFEAHLNNQPADAAAWFNLGNAYSGAGDAGLAVWAWRTALELTPRDDAARRNLRLMGNATLAGAPPAFSLTPAETGLLLGIVWWIAAFGTAVMVIRNGRPPRWLVIAAAASAVAILAAFAPAWLRARSAVALEEMTPLLSGPAIRSDTVAVVAAGTPVRVVGREGNWLRVRTTDQAEGWGNPERFLEVSPRIE